MPQGREIMGCRSFSSLCRSLKHTRLVGWDYGQDLLGNVFGSDSQKKTGEYYGNFVIGRLRRKLTPIIRLCRKIDKPHNEYLKTTLDSTGKLQPGSWWHGNTDCNTHNPIEMIGFGRRLI